MKQREALQLLQQLNQPKMRIAVLDCSKTTESVTFTVNGIMFSVDPKHNFKVVELTMGGMFEQSNKRSEALGDLLKATYDYNDAWEWLDKHLSKTPESPQEESPLGRKFTVQELEDMRCDKYGHLG